MNYPLILPALLLALPASAHEPQVEVARYLGGKPAALTMTFDDGLQEHFTKVFPLLQQHGLRATFGIIGSKVGGQMKSKAGTVPCITWDEARQMAEGGQEITNHGYEHKNVTKLTMAQLAEEVGRNDSIILANTGHRPRTYLYPGNRKSSESVAYCEQGRTTTRTYQISMGNKRSADWFDQYAKQIIGNGSWGITMTHGITAGYDHFDDPSIFTTIIERAAELKDSLWIAPLEEVGAYVKERDSVKLDVKVTRRAVIIRPTLALDPKVYHMPLTILIDGKPYDIDPYRKKIKIKRQ